VSSEFGRVEEALPTYEITSVIGRGGFGLVLAGHHRHLNRPVAVKMLTADPYDSDGRRRFLAEARLLERLSHPHIVRLYDYVESGDLRLLVMERLGESLRARASSGLTADVVVAVGLAMADALESAHARGVLHRDVKPDNVLFADDGRAKVTDFGIAKIVETTIVRTNTLIGTPLYMAPEQFTLGQLGPGSDLYSLGVVLYELFSGTPPFPRQLGLVDLANHHVQIEPAPLTTAPARIAALIRQALEKNLADRPSSARAFAIELAAAAADAFGPDWLNRCPMPLAVDDEVREAARGPSRHGTTTPPGGTTRPGQHRTPGDQTPPGHHTPPSVTTRPGTSIPSPSISWPSPTRQPPSTPPVQPYPPAQQPHADSPTWTPDQLTWPPPRTEAWMEPPARPPTPPVQSPPPLPAPLPPPPPPPSARPADAGADRRGGRRGRQRQADRPGLVVMHPYGLAGGPDGSLFVSQPLPHRVIRITAQGQVLPFAGTGKAGFAGDGGRPEAAELNMPYGIAVDPGGAVYFADHFNNRVRRVSPEGWIATVAGHGSPGSPLGKGTRRRATEAPVSGPRSVAVDPLGGVYVTSTDSHQILRVDPEGYIELVAGSGVAGFGGDGHAATGASLNQPSDVAVLGGGPGLGGGLVVADTGNRRLRYVGPDGRISSIGGSPMAGLRSFGTLPSGVLGRADQVDLGRPSSVALGPSGSLFVTDSSTHRIFEVTIDGLVRVAAGTGSPAGNTQDGVPAAIASLDSPRGLFVGVDGAVYIAEQGRHRIRVLMPNGTITTLGA
jgi:serine/threonine-protein kinase